MRRFGIEPGLKKKTRQLKNEIIENKGNIANTGKIELVKSDNEWIKRIKNDRNTGKEEKGPMEQKETENK